MEYLKSAAVMGLPSWKVMPSRRVNVYTVPVSSTCPGLGQVGTDGERLVEADKAAVDAGDVEVGGGLAGHGGVKGAGLAEGHGERPIPGDAVGCRQGGVEAVEGLRLCRPAVPEKQSAGLETAIMKFALPRFITWMLTGDFTPSDSKRRSARRTGEPPSRVKAFKLSREGVAPVGPGGIRWR